MIESATFWKNGPEIDDRRDRARGVPHRGVLPAGRVARGEGGHLHPDPADAAVAGEGRRAAGRLPLRAVVLLPPGPDGAGAAGRLHRPARPARCWTSTWDYPVARRARRAERRGRAAARSTATTSPTGAPLSAFTEMKDDGSTLGGCWIYSGVYADGVNQAARRKPGASRPGWRPSGAGPGRRTGASSTTAPPPTRTGKPWSERKKLRLVGRGRGRVDRPRRARLREDQAAVVPAAGGRDRRRRRSPATTRSSCRRDGKGWLFAPAGPGRRAAADALRAGRVAGAQPAVRPAGQPDPQGVRSGRTTGSTRARRRSTARSSRTCSRPAG